MATRSRVFGGEGFSVLVQVARGPMQGHSWVKFEVSRVFIAQLTAYSLQTSCAISGARGGDIGRRSPPGSGEELGWAG
jgi:hypothetical protein